MSTAAEANPFEEDRLNESADYRRAWDVPSLNAEVSDWLSAEVAALQASPPLTASRKIAVLLGPPGYGKTHLFGRIADTLGQDVAFVFVPQILEEQLTRPLQHLRWHVVKCLFDPAEGNLTRVCHLLATLCRESFEDYFDKLPEQLRARHQPIRQKLQNEPKAVMEILSASKDLGPYQKLADSVVARFPRLPSDIVRAVALGWSPASNDVWRWLRGDDIADAERKRIGLKDEAPPASEVIKAIATLLQEIGLPMVICCDQLDAVLKNITVGPQHFSQGLVQLLQEVPNLLLVISCFSDKWEVLANHWVKAFPDRCHPPRQLATLSEQQAVDLASNRLKDWRGRPKGKDGTWPIVETSIRSFVAKRPQHPRTLVKTCKIAIDKFLLGKNGEAVSLGPETIEPPIEDLFTQYWNSELEKIKAATRSPDDAQEESLFQGVFEAIGIVRMCGQLPAGIAIREIKKGALQSGSSDARPSFLLELTENNKNLSVVVAVTKRDTGAAFSAYMKALDTAVGQKNISGAVLIRPRLEPGVNKNSEARKKYDALIGSRKLRPFALELGGLTFAILDCLLKVLNDADGKMIQLAKKTLSSDECRKLIGTTGVLKSLPLFELIFTGWNGEKKSEASTEAIVAPAIEPAAIVVPAKSLATAPPVSQPVAAAPTPVVKPISAPPPTAISPKPAPPVPSASTPLTPAAPPAPASEMRTWALEMLRQTVEKLRNFGLPVKALGVQIGPCFARLKVLPEDQTDINKVRRKDETLRVFLKLRVKPIISSQAGFLSIDLELPRRLPVPLLPLLKKRPLELVGQPAFPLGLDVSGKDHWLNLADTAYCHLLIAGTTGSGKSELMKAILASLADGMSPKQLQIVLIDPKRVTFNFPGVSPYFRAPIAHDSGEAIPLLQACVEEMESRYQLLEKNRMQNVSELKGAAALPQIVLFFDEFADLMQDRESKKEMETLLKRLGAMARAAGIHLILGTQRTEASVVTPLLRSNLPGRISLKVTSERDSELILDNPGASALLGKGDLLWSRGGDMLRLQCPLVKPEQLDLMLKIK